MPKKRIFVAGHLGMVGSAITRQLLNNNNSDVVTALRSDLDLTNQSSVRKFFEHQRFDEVYLAAAKVGGIHANSSYPAEFIYENLMIECNVINAAHINGVQKLLFLGSSCIYPRLANQPMTESALLSGALEPTNEPYAVAKIAGIKLCESYNRQYGRDYRSVMPTNLYGPGDNYSSKNSHVIPGLIRRFHEAKINNEAEVLAWGTGQPKREFLYVEDMAAASVFIMNLPMEAYSARVSPTLSHLNIGSGVEITIEKLTQLIAKTVGFAGKITWDDSKPDGAPRKLLDSSQLHCLGFNKTTPLAKGLALAYDAFCNTHKNN